LAHRIRTAFKEGNGDHLAKFISTKAIKDFVSKDLEGVIKNPIKFKTEKGSVVYGYEATVHVQKDLFNKI